MATINPGFTGYAKTATNYCRFNTCNVNPTQTIEAPEMVMGDYTHNAWAYGKIEVGGSLSGPVTESSMAFLKELWGDSATAKGLWTPGGFTIYVKYYEGFEREFQGIQINQITFTITAGEIVNFNADLIGTGMVDSTTLAGSDYTLGEKLVTWDKAALRVGDLEDASAVTFGSLAAYTGLQSVSITITKNVTRQFVIAQSSLFGNLVQGMHAVTGNLVSYTSTSGLGETAGAAYGSGANYWDQYNGNQVHGIEFDIGAYTVSAGVRFHRATTELNTGPVLTTLGFTGVTHEGWGRIA